MITDEVYEHQVFDDFEHIPLATLPGMFERTITLSSAGKTFSFTGWKIGWATGPRELVREVMAAKQWLSFSSGTPLQAAIAHEVGHVEFRHGLRQVRSAQKSGLAGAIAGAVLGAAVGAATDDVVSTA